jgi:hypothetical protein
MPNPPFNQSEWSTPAILARAHHRHSRRSFTPALMTRSIRVSQSINNLKEIRMPAGNLDVAAHDPDAVFAIDNGDGPSMPKASVTNGHRMSCGEPDARQPAPPPQDRQQASECSGSQCESSRRSPWRVRRSPCSTISRTRETYAIGRRRTRGSRCSPRGRRDRGIGYASGLSRRAPAVRPARHPPIGADMLAVCIPGPGRQRRPPQIPQIPLHSGTDPASPSPVRLLVDVDFGRCEAATAGLVDVPPDGSVF